jgi:hypothetical protein
LVAGDPGAIRGEGPHAESRHRFDERSGFDAAPAIRSTVKMVTRARFLNARGFALHVGYALGRNHKLLAHRSQFAHIFDSEAGLLVSTSGHGRALVGVAGFEPATLNPQSSGSSH